MKTTLRLKERRVQLNLTQKQVAERSHLVESTYQRYEYGAVAPSVVVAIQIAKALESTVEELFIPLQ